MPGRLILIRHSQSAADSKVPVHRWGLTDEGRRRCETLAARLSRFSPAIVASSPEPKALDTATLTMARLGHDTRLIRVVDGLREHARETMPWLSQEEFDEKLNEFFARPDVLVIGEETAGQALLRFTRAIASIVGTPELKLRPTADGRPASPETSQGQDILVFTHATVMTLFVAACTGQDAFAFWQSLGMPAFAVLTRGTGASLPGRGSSRPPYTLEETVASLGESA